MAAGGVTDPLRTVVITMVKNESTFLPLWTRYYGSVFGESNLLVVDDSSTDGSTQDLAGSVVRLPDYAVGEAARGSGMGFASRRSRLITRLAHALRTYYDAVIYTDVDEFLVADPARYESLADYVAQMTEPVVGAVGLNLVHVRALEAPYDPTRPILEQRRHVKFTPKMCKPLISRKDLVWYAGFHGCSRDFRIDPDLMLVHAKFFDYDFVVEHQAKRNALFAAGRGGPFSTWSMPVSDVQEKFDSWSSNAEAAATLDTAALNLDIVAPVERSGRTEYESRGVNQKRTMNRGEVALLPDSLRSQF